MKKFILYIIPLFIFSFILFTCSAQDLTTESKKAIKYYEKAILCYDNRKYAEAEIELKKAIKTDSGFIEAHMVLAGIYIDMGKIDFAIDEYRRSIDIDPGFFPPNYYNIGVLEQSKSHYNEAREHFTQFLKYDVLNPKLKRNALHNIEVCKFAIEAIKNPVPFNPVNLGDSVNSKYDEYLPTITADEQTLIITVREPADEYTYFPNDGHEENFYICRKVGGVWSKAVELGPPINTPGNEGAQCISVDGQILIYTACERPDGKGSCDLYFARRIGDKWSKPMNMGPPINTKYWDSQPSLSSDGRTLYFVSNRSGGKGDKDIWQSTLTDEGVWGKPVNLGDKINTTESEQSPFIHTDNQTLYFSSSGLIGMGGEDLFILRKDKNGEWGEPVNLGYPVNTFADESSLIVNASGETAYFASSSLEGKGGFDLYSFELHKTARPVKVTYFKGKVFNSVTNESIRARFELIDLETGKTVVESYSNKGNGEFLVCLPTGKNYALNISQKGHLFYSEHFSLKDIEGDTSGSAPEPFLMNVPLQPIEVGGKVVLKNIFYETGSYQLKDESEIELQMLIFFMNKNQTVKIEISGHTDNVGDIRANQILSENRAKTVYDYLINLHLMNPQGFISKERLSYKGYGETKPIASNDTDEGRALNRRTELIVTEK
ncbi:MAG: OmpA family protein [Bacteroidota bacterium]